MSATGDITDNIGTAAAFGAVAWIVGYIISYVGSSVIFDFNLGTNVGGGGGLQISIAGWKLGGMYFFGAHFVETKASISMMGQSISQGSNPVLEEGGAALILLVVPILVLLGAGYLLGQQMRGSDPTAAAQSGALLVAGYLPLSVVGVFLFEWSLGQDGASLSIAPDMITGIILAGIVYPVVLGGIGGYLGAQA